MEKADHAGVGIDIETIIPVSMQEVLVTMAVSAAELAYLRSIQTALPLHTLLSLAFSAKESFFKAAFGMVGRYFDFDAVEIIHMDFSEQSIRFRIQDTLCAELTAGAVRNAHFAFIDADTICTSCDWRRTG